MIYADIIIEISHEKLDRTFQYRVPEELAEAVRPGAFVKIPFGKGDRKIGGYVIELSDSPKIDPGRIRDIEEVSSVSEAEQPVLRLLQLAVWMKRHYGGNTIQALKCVLPSKAYGKEKQRVLLHLTEDREKAEKSLVKFRTAHQKARERLLSALLETGTLDQTLVIRKLNVSGSVIKALKEQGLLTVSSVPLYRNPRSFQGNGQKIEKLSDAQARIVSDFLARYDRGERTPALIHGVTGSGKTEVYIRMIEGVVSRGKQAIMLIPEIALTFQTVVRFTERFGDRVSYLHSKLSGGERYDQFLRAMRGEIDVMIGPRSALFTPFPETGIIIMDEEHETSYRSEITPRYHTRETAAELARLCGAAFVMGSATPSIDAYYRAKKGEYRLYELPSRANPEAVLPTVYTVDLREELRKGNRSVFSERLYSLMQKRLQNKEQIMLFLNRRGYAGFISCRKCGFIYKCPHCDVSLTAHRNGQLVCHYCGYSTPAVKQCPECGSRYIGGMKAGTEQIEQKLHEAFPEARVLRMDMDTTRGKGDYEKILSSFANEEADILLGTQMIVKGHDFPNVTLMGILVADMSLYSNDYRAGERTFQLLTQAAGRAGRAGRPGEVVIQTYSVDHPAVIYAAGGDYQGFYKQEIEYRSLCGYPPAMHLLKITAEDREEEEAERLIEEVCRLARKTEAFVIGPSSPAIARLNDIYRRQLFLKSEDEECLIALKDTVERMRESTEEFRGRLEFEFD